MAHLSDRWVGIVLRIVRGYYPDAELAVWGAYVEAGAERNSVAEDSGRGSDRLDLVMIEPPSLSGDALLAIRTELERSDLPMECDVRSFADLTLREQSDVLDRGIRISG